MLEFTAAELGRQMFLSSYKPNDSSVIGRALAKIAREDERFMLNPIHNCARYRLPVRKLTLSPPAWVG